MHTSVLARLAPRSVLCLALAAVAAGCQDVGEDKSESGAEDPGGTDGSDGDGGDGGGPDYEEGCHILDGGQGFAWLNDAIAAASEGSTIQVCADGGVHEEAVVVSKAVDIIGPGAAQLVLVGPVNEVPLTVTASGATVSGLGIQGTRSGVVIAADEAAGGAPPSDVLLSDIELTELPNWGVRVDGATGVILDDIVVIGGGYGGMLVEQDAEVTLSNSLLQSNATYGIQVQDATLAIQGTEVLQTAPAEDDTDQIAENLHLDEGAVVVSSGSTYSSAEATNIYAAEAELSMTGDVVEGAIVGIELRQATVQLTEVTVDRAFAVGIIADSQEPMTFTDVDVLGDLESNYEEDPTNWNIIEVDDDGNITNWPIGGAGVFAIASDLAWDGGTISGWHNAGALLLTPTDENLTSLANLTIEGVERFGIVSGARNYLGFAPVLEVTDVSILEPLLVDDWGEDSAPCGSVDLTNAFYQVDGRTEWTGGLIQGSGGYGFVNNQGVLQLDGVTVADHTCGGVINFVGSARVSNSTFTGGGGTGESALMAAYIDYEGASSTLEANTFSGNRVDYDVVYEGTSGDSTTRTVYHDTRGYDIFAANAASLSLDGNTFENGYNAVQAEFSTVEMTNNLFSGYYNRIFYGYSATLEGAGNEATNTQGTSGNFVFAYQSTIELDDTVVNGVALREYTYDYYLDEVPVVEGATTTTYGQPFYFYDSNVSLDGAEISNVLTNPFYISSSSSSVGTVTELVDVTLDSVNTDSSRSYYGAIYHSSYYSGVHELYIEGLQVTNIANDSALEVFNLYDGSSYLAELNLTVTDSSIDTVDAFGLYLYGEGLSTELTDTTITGTGSAAVHTIDGSIALDNVAVSQTDSSGLRFTDTTVTVTSASSSTENTDYGMTCSGATTIDDCASIDLGLNGVGESDGCESACGETL
jgi:hypothetical protein